jgi:hypothetical protein
MTICRRPAIISMLVTLTGAVFASLGDWSAVAIYGVGTAGIVVYFALLPWGEAREAREEAARSARR